MKTIGNFIKEHKRIFSFASISVIVFFTFLILVFVTLIGLTFQTEKIIDSPHQKSYTEIIKKTDPDKKVNPVSIHHIGNTKTSKLKLDIKIPQMTKAIDLSLVMNDDQINEKELKMESWMLESKLFVQPMSCSEDELEKPLELEEWMINNEYWK